MDASTVLALILSCAPAVHPLTARALIAVESGYNPWAIGVVDGVLLRQPANRKEALATAKALRAAGWNFSIGLGQINVGNLSRMGLTLESAFEPCANLRAMQAILLDCYARTRHLHPAALDEQTALRQALSCYYSGDFSTGLRHGYVTKLVAAAAALR